MWDAITWQWTEYGQIEREFPRYYDWMHHGEANLFHYFFGLTKPESVIDRQRAIRFAHMYDGSDPLAPNYDPELHLIKAPMSGSNGPRHVVTEEDWSTHRGVLTDYLAPFEDMESVDFALLKCDWRDDAVYAEVIEKMNERPNKGDVPLNLNATSQFTHAYLYTGDPAFGSGWSTTSPPGKLAPTPTAGSCRTTSGCPERWGSISTASGGAATTAGAGRMAISRCSSLLSTPGTTRC